MRRLRGVEIVLVALVAVWPSFSVARNRAYAIEVLDPSGASSVYPGIGCINNRGDVVGWLQYNEPSRLVPVVWRGTEPIALTTLGGSLNVALAVNAKGDVVGAVEIPDEAPSGSPTIRAVRWEKDGVPEELGTLGGTGSVAYGVNNSGLVVGAAETGAIDPLTNQPVLRACAWHRGSVHDLGALGGVNSFAVASNGSGVIIGGAETTEIDPLTGWQLFHAFRFDDDTMSDLGTLGGLSSQAYAINEGGRVVGSADIAHPAPPSPRISHAFLWSDGVMHDLGTLDGEGVSGAFDINSSDQVVGVSEVPRTPTGVRVHGFLWTGRELLDLNDLVPADSAWEILEGTCINDAGEIVAVGRNRDRPQVLLLRLRPK